MKWKNKAGETPLNDLSGLKPRISNPTRSQIEKFEAMNVAKAEEKYFARRLTPRRAPFDLRWIKKLHREMFGDVWRWAGELRAVNLNIGVSKEQVQIQLLQLLDDLKSWPDYEDNYVLLAARLHHRAVWIHPFENGNGRWARMLSNIWLRKQGRGCVAWPATTDKTSPVREEYVTALKQADAMNETPLYELHKRYWSKV